MANYVVLASFTDQGIKGVKETNKRAKGFRDAAKAMNCTFGEERQVLPRKVLAH